MSTSVTLPNTIQMRPSRLTGLVVGVAILTGVVTWSVSQVATDSPASGTSKSEVVSTSSAAAKAYVDGVVALSPEQRAARVADEVVEDGDRHALGKPQASQVEARGESPLELPDPARRHTG